VFINMFLSFTNLALPFASCLELGSFLVFSVYKLAKLSFFIIV
jgi:hypothetical protein